MDPISTLIPDGSTGADVFFSAATYVAVILGLTAVVGKFVPQASRDAMMPLVAFLIGVGVCMLGAYALGELVTPAGFVQAFFMGVILGGASTGLYSVGKQFSKSA